MVRIQDITNTIFSSKTYILYKEGDNKAWLVDIGDIEPVFSFLKGKQLGIGGVFLTHAHFDHIYGLESLVSFFLDCKVYGTEYTKESLASDKLNLSKYYGTPFIYDRDNFVVVHDGEHMQLFKDEPQMFFFETPGHNPGCLTMVVGDYIFTGDSYIPDIGVNAILPRANKENAYDSLKRILKMAEGKRILAGH